MAVFTAVATSIVTALGATVTAAGVTIAGSALLGSLAVGVVATGLMAGTAKLLGLTDPPKGGGAKDPGLKVQLGPSTDRRVPRLYGRNFTGGTIIDAEIKNQNQTMAYALVISEYGADDTWSVNKIFRGDALLLFGTGQNGHIVQSQVDPNDTANDNVSGKMRVRIYAGGSEASNQIFPAGAGVTPVPAYGSGSGQIARWTSANTMEDLVFAVIEIDYDPENGLTGLGAFTYDINNSLNAPGDVLEDYLLNTRYGAGLPQSMIDLGSLADLNTYSNQQVEYIDEFGTTQTHERYQIDGALSTFNNVKSNINKICQACGAFFTYNTLTGQFAVVVNREATQSEKDNAYVFTDDNMISDIKITETDLFSLYNAVQVEYASINKKDQTDTFYAEVPANIRNPNEPDNTLQYRLEMTNDRARVSNLATVDLNQSRISKVIEVELDATGMSLQVGDVVKLTSQLYGFDEKLFRVMRLTEKESGEGALSVEVLMLEYLDAVYGDILTQEDLPPPVTGIPGFYNNPEIRANSNIAVANVVIDAFNNPNTNVFVGVIPDSVVVGLSNALLVLDDLEDDLANLDANLVILNNDLANLEISLDDNTDAIANLNANLITLNNTLDDAQDDIANLNANLITLDNNLANAQIDINNNSNTIITLNNDLANAQIELSDNANAITDLNSNLSIAQQELDDNANAIADLDGLFPITETSISNGAITTPKMTVNTILGDRIATGTLNADRITAGSITTDRMTANSIDGDRIATNTLNADRIVAGSITTDRMTANTIDGDRIATNTLNADRITAGSITTDRMTANSIDGDRILAGSLEAGKITAGSITTTQLDAGNINGNVITANSMEGDRIAINTLNGDRIIADTINGNAIIAETLSGNAIIGNSLSGNTIIGQTLNGNAIIAGTLTAGNIFAANLAALSTSTGTLFVDQLSTSSNFQAQRVELTGPQIDTTYAIWIGGGNKTDSNAVFYVKQNGDAFIKKQDFDITDGGVTTGAFSNAGGVAGLNGNSLSAASGAIAVGAGGVSFEVNLFYQAFKSQNQISESNCAVSSIQGEITLQRATNSSFTSGVSNVNSITFSEFANRVYIPDPEPGLAPGICSNRMVLDNNKTFVDQPTPGTYYYRLFYTQWLSNFQASETSQNVIYSTFVASAA